MYIKVGVVTVTLTHLNHLNSHIHLDYHVSHYLLFPLNFCEFHCQAKHNVHADTYPFFSLLYKKGYI